VITYRHGFHFDLAPAPLWDRLGAVDEFEEWWPWLTDLSLDGDGLVSGSVLSGAVSPPLPYRMRVEVELVDCTRPSSIDAVVRGDLTGAAELRVRPEGEGSWAEVAWAMEMRQPVMRLADRLGHPLLQWGHDRVVESTVAGFRRRIAPD
jgi:hypothetical protein